MHIGLFFGSFNPIHYGHISIAEQMLRKVGFDEVWLVVSPQNPLKENKTLQSEHDRLAMTRLAVSNQDLPIRVSDIEINLPKPSYTIITLDELRRRYPDIVFSLIMGSDNVAVIEQWKDYEEILKRYNVYFFPRTGDSSDELAKKYGIIKVAGDFLDISSTQIRNLLCEGKSVKGLVPPEVEEYIAKHNLYK